ncbi:MAG: Fe3+/siderophore ABC transporter permease [Candidatus Cloacimonetes bacterium HGW-Cloacimonetes-1]|jgi:iron complex transport system permease protein|nr:MAG: Fe3+/siderophore ABC transporter permease [Candidatus Cloacimonetes bacterium HGW-Cloacimonetes-1]
MSKRNSLLLIIALSYLAMIGIYLTVGHPDGFIILNIRIPRLVLTLLTGMSLAGIGSVYQLMLANPLADPYILGISSGAALGSILMGVLGLVILMPLGGFAGAVCTMLLVWALAQKSGQFDRSRLLIAGIIAGMFFAAGISLLMYLFQEDSLIILGTLMGNLGRIFSVNEWRVFLGLSVFALLLMVFLYRKSLVLDIMSGGDIYAGSVGINVLRTRRQIFWITSLLLGIVVAYAGIIGFVGLIVPHIVRFFIPSGQKKIFIYSTAMGGVFLLFCDFLAQHLTTLELPVGVVTAFIGCPFFMWLLLRK